MNDFDIYKFSNFFHNPRIEVLFKTLYFISGVGHKQMVLTAFSQSPSNMVADFFSLRNSALISRFN